MSDLGKVDPRVSLKMWLTEEISVLMSQIQIVFISN